MYIYIELELTRSDLSAPVAFRQSTHCLFFETEGRDMKYRIHVFINTYVYIHIYICIYIYISG